MRRWVAVAFSLLLFSCQTAEKKEKVVITVTDTPLRELKKEVVVPKLQVSPLPPGSVIPAKYIRVYRCSYVDDRGNLRKGEFITIKVREEKLKASF
jgi:hypothetical protein